ncbi:MAG: DUF2780 domain-containing protein [Sulfuricurvum sp.]
MIRSLALTAALLASTNSFAFDFSSMMQTVAPIAQSAAPAVDTSLSSNPLVKNLTTTLGVTPTQAIGGSAAILYDAKSSMKSTDYATLTKEMPQVGSLLSAVPSSFLKTGSTASQFSLLGMDASMIGKFTPLVLQYIQGGTTPGMAQVVQTALAQ